jgi:DNA-binding response OmpR family regulator
MAGMDKKIHVLLAEDDAALGFVIKDNLEEKGYEVTHCTDGQSAIQQFDKQVHDIVLLDVMMPAKDGFSVAGKIRQQSDVVPILFITSRSMEEDRIKGFETGADDYITKPFSIKELLLRMEVFLRRSKKIGGTQNSNFQLGTLTFHFSDLKIVDPDGKAQTLTQKEAELLKFFCEHRNMILKREEVLLNVWGKDDYFLGRSMDVFITKLRKHLKTDPQLMLETIHGIGYRFNVPD